jgi:GNAT superfamily N-acetyltransferase
MNLNHNEPCQFLEWDSNFLGFRIARVLAEHLDDQNIKQIYDWSEQNAIDCLYFLANADDTHTIRTAEELDFLLVEIRLNFECWLKDWDPGTRPKTTTGVTVRAARLEDLPALQKIASTAYVDSRYYTDEHFSRDIWQAYYATWVKNSCEGGSEMVLVAEAGDEVLGYTTGTFDHDKTGSGRVELIAVRQDVRKLGVGRELLLCGMDWYSQHNVNYVWLSTQGRNIAMQRMIQKNGFVTRSCQLYFHKWLRDNPKTAGASSADDGSKGI